MAEISPTEEQLRIARELYKRGTAQAIAQALAAAHQRGREAAAKAVEDKAEELRLVADRHRATGREDVAYRLGFTASHLFALRDAIRSLKTNAIAQRAAEGGGEQNETTAAVDNPESNHTGGQAIAEARREMGP